MPCITLLSDFGLQDASIAISRGILMQHTTVPIIDISHEVAQYNTTQAAYLLRAAYNNFPAGTNHLLLTDLFSDTNPALILCEHDGHYFLTPDNGHISLALGTVPLAWHCGYIDTFIQWLHRAGDIINKLQELRPAALGLPAYQLKHTPLPASPILSNESISCDVLHIDYFGNVALNVTRQQVESLRNGRQFRLQFTKVEEITGAGSGYDEVREGTKLCRFNRSGYLEVCINRGHAASLFGLRYGGKLNDIKILFE